ncbi:hypothetical protein ABC195_10235 [Microbacterium sp. 2P01SA-2]|uniref:hypothetical protein n=1 Tax=unclassified Microbacterium TaxID=2609290 RepID=UPI0039A20324
MRMRTALATGAAGAAVVLSLAGCASIPLGPPPVREVATVAETMSCPDPMLNPLSGAGLVPDGFEVVAVLECANGVTREDADGVIAGNEVRRYEGDLTEFLDAMAAPSDPGPAAVCPAVGYAFRAIWATDAAGRFVPLSFPSTACGGPKEDEPLAALARLEVVDRTFSAAERVELRDATTAGCETRADVAPLTVLGWTPPETHPSVDVDRALACVYQADAPDAPDDAVGTPTFTVEGGLFATAFSLDATSAHEVLTAAAGPAAAPACGDAASRFVVLHPRTVKSAVNAPVTVELDGCQRIIGTDFQARPAPPEVVALLVDSLPAP